MSNIHQSILEKLTALNIDIYHYEEIVRCYAQAKLNIEHSQKPDYTDGIHTAEFAAEVSRYQLLSPDENPYYDSPAFFSLCSELVSTGMDKDSGCFLKPSHHSWFLTGIGLCPYSLKDFTRDWPICFI